MIRATRAIGGLDLQPPGAFGAGASGPDTVHEPLPPDVAQDELSRLQFAFEEMRQRLATAKVEIDAFTRELERKVETRTSELESAREQLYRSERLASLGRLAASVAHEINNPISGILNLSRLVLRLIDSGGIPPDRIEEVRGYLSQVTEETTRIGRIVSDLLSFARQTRPRIEPTNLADLARRTLSLLSLKLRMRSIEAVLDASPGVPRVACDAGQVEQVLINLVMNAAEASPDGATVQVRLLNEAREGFVTLEVADRGTGIPPEHLARIFDPFFTTKEDGKGVGLGLAVAYGIVESHGGTIDVRSQAGHGTTFRVRLPVEGRATPPQGRGGKA